MFLGSIKLSLTPSNYRRDSSLYTAQKIVVTVTERFIVAKVTEEFIVVKVTEYFIVVKVTEDLSLSRLPKALS